MNWTLEEYNEFLKRQGKEPQPVKRANKYHAKRTDGYDSKHEAKIAAQLQLRAKAERIVTLEQVPFPLPGGVIYRADFVVLKPGGVYEILDAKGVRTDVYN